MWLAKSIVSRRYSNWSYLVGLLKASKEFNVRALRSINLPLIYSFLIMGIFKIFGSSPGSTNYCKDRKAEIHP
jgi:hypoxanthine-guanine phosphoribosyltransferase